MATMRLMSRVVPSSGESNTAISPRSGVDEPKMSIFVNGIRKPYDILLTMTRSPGINEYSIEPDGT